MLFASKELESGISSATLFVTSVSGHVVGFSLNNWATIAESK
jgi:hypothetical protein